jgi:hypothetical protein
MNQRKEDEYKRKNRGEIGRENRRRIGKERREEYSIICINI